MKVGLMVIATNKYIQFVQPLYDSYRKYFLTQTNLEPQFLVFSDSNFSEASVNISVKHLKWPGPTLKRYHMFCDNAKKLQHLDYLFYCDADMLFVHYIGEEILSPLTATLHPGFFTGPRERFTYDNNPRSTAYVAPNEGIAYYCGGFNGGTTGEFLKMAETIKTNIDVDEKNKVLARWHDESHLNRYLINRPPNNTLDPGYCFFGNCERGEPGLLPSSYYPITNKIPFEPKLVALMKNHGELRT